MTEAESPNTTTTTTTTAGLSEPDHGDDMVYTSKRVHLSLRGMLTGVIVATACVMSAIGIPVMEPLYGMTLISIGWYFGRSQRKQP